MKLSDQERSDAMLHATVWENVFNVAGENAVRRNDIDRNLLRNLSIFALIIAGEYRKIANGADIQD